MLQERVSLTVGSSQGKEAVSGQGCIGVEKKLTPQTPLCIGGGQIIPRARRKRKENWRYKKGAYLGHLSEDRFKSSVKMKEKMLRLMTTEGGSGEHRWHESLVGFILHLF